MQWLNDLDEILERKLAAKADRRKRNNNAGDTESSSTVGTRPSHPLHRNTLETSSSTAVDFRPANSLYPNHTDTRSSSVGNISPTNSFSLELPLLMIMKSDSTPDYEESTSNMIEGSFEDVASSALVPPSIQSPEGNLKNPKHSKPPQGSFWRNAPFSPPRNQVTNKSEDPKGGSMSCKESLQTHDNLTAANASSYDDDSEGEAIYSGSFTSGFGKGSSMIDWQTRDIELKEQKRAEREDYSDFCFTSPFPKWNDLGGIPFEPSMNCYGVVHVRVLRAQRLPCPVGSTVYAIVSLPPWQGRVKTERTSAFLPSLQHGVCVRWDQPNDGGLVSMINAWSSDDSPVPSIKIDLMFSPLGMGVFEFSMCVLTLSCEVLMQSPGIWREQWCPAMVADTKSDSAITDEGKVPLIQVEAMFAPPGYEQEQSAHVDSNSIGANGENIVHDSEESNQLSLKNPSFDESVDASVSTVRSGLPSVVIQVPKNPAKQHLLRIVTLWMPASCAVCSKVIIGMNQGFRCEECEIHCCSDCRLIIDLQIPCGSEIARAAVQQSIQNKFTLGNLLSIVAPDSAFKLDDSHAATGTSQPTPARSLINDFDARDLGIGCLKLEFIRACLFEKPIPADSETGTVVDHGKKGPLRRADYYVRVTPTGGHKTARTRTVQNTSMPVFGSGEMRFNV